MFGLFVNSGTVIAGVYVFVFTINIAAGRLVFVGPIAVQANFVVGIFGTDAEFLVLISISVAFVAFGVISVLPVTIQAYQ